MGSHWSGPAAGGQRTRRRTAPGPPPGRRQPEFLCLPRHARFAIETLSPPAASCSVESDCVAQLLEEALGHLLRLAGEASDLPEQGFLLGREVLRDDDLHHDVLVAAAPAAHVWHAPPRHPERLPVLGARRDGDLHRTFERRYLDAISERRLHDVDPELVDDVLVAPGQVGVRLDPQHDVEVARRAAPEAALPLPAQTDLRPGVDTARDPHGQPARPLEAPLAPALHARVLQQAARAAAGRAGRGGDHRTEDRLRGAPDLARSAAAGTRLLSTAGLRAAAGAALARGEARNVDLLLDADVSLLERDGHVVAQVVAAVGALAASAGPPSPAEKRVEDVRERHVGEVDGRASRLHGGVTEHAA